MLRPAALSVLALAALPLSVLLLAGAQAASLPPYFTDTLVVGGLNTPRSLAFFPNGSILAVENGGGFVLVQGGGHTTLATLTGISTTGEQGLLGVAIDPGYPARPYIYIHYTTSSNVQVARVTLSNATGAGPLGVDLASKLVYLQDMPNVNTNHNGGTVRFGPDKDLYISIGDDATGGCDAQNISWMAGKILRIKVDDTADPANRITLAPLDNPFYNASDANASLVWALGLRNPFRFDIDRVSGKLYIGDVGQSAFEEIDVSAGGENFGWPYKEGFADYRTSLCPGATAFPAWTLPIFTQPNTVGAAIIGSTVYRGVNYSNDASLPPEFDENPFFFDFYNGTMRVLRKDANGTSWSLVPGVDAQNFSTGMVYVTDMRVGPDGALYWLSASTNELRRIAYASVPRVLASGLPAATVGVPYDAALAVEGNAPPYTWTLLAGSLPSGLALNATTGHISGSPSAAGNSTFTVEVRSAAGRNSSANLSIEVADPITLAPATLPDGVEGQPYTVALAALGGVAPFLFAVEVGALPPGLSLAPNSGHITGTSTAFGVWNFTVNATDAQGRVGLRGFALRLAASLQVTTDALPRGVQGAWYETSLLAAGGTPPFAWAVNANASLPLGLALGAGNGTLYGVPSGPIATTVEFEVADSGGQSASKAIDIVIAPRPGEAPLIATVTLPPATLGVAYSVSFQVAAGVAPFVWTQPNGSLAAGLVFDAPNASLEGVPTALGLASFSVRVADSYGRADERNYTLRVDLAVRSLEIDPVAMADGEVGADYPALQLRATGVNLTLPLRWNASGLPPGLALDGAGLLSGRPTAAGVFEVQVVARDSSPDPLEAQAFFSLNTTRVAILPVPTSDLSNVAVGSALVLPLRLAADLSGINWTVTAGELPPGLRLDAEGVLRGTPTAVGAFAFTVRATRVQAPDDFGEQNVTIQVFPATPPACSPCPAPGPAPQGGSWLPWILALAAAAGLFGYLARRARLRYPRDAEERP